MATQRDHDSLEINYPSGELNPPTKYYVLFRYEGEFKIIHMDAPSAALWKAAGWEFRCLNSKMEAQNAMEKWKASLVAPTPAGIRAPDAQEVERSPSVGGGINAQP
jgi:hypothetical protein